MKTDSNRNWWKTVEIFMVEGELKTIQLLEEQISKIQPSCCGSRGFQINE